MALPDDAVAGADAATEPSLPVSDPLPPPPDTTPTASTVTGAEPGQTTTTTPSQQQQQPRDEATATAAPEQRNASTSSSSAPPAPAGLALSISLLLITGARHPYTIDERYLRSRSLEPRNAAGDIDPRELSGYQLKELIWTDWRAEWEPKPANPSSIRLIILGRMIEDKSALKDFPFKSQPGDSVVVHMTVRPADLDADDDGAATKSSLHRRSHRSREGEVGEEERGAGCRCVIL